MSLRVIAATVFSLLAVPAMAKCTGASYLDQLSASDKAALADAVADIPFAQGILWTARKDDREITLVGTMHIYDPRLEDIRAQISDDVTSADLILLEATPEDEANLQQLIATDPGMLFITDGPTLPELLDEETWTMISEAANARMIPSFMASKMQPWYLSMMLAIPPCAVQDMAQGDRGLDHMIMADAEAAGVPMQALESFTTLFDIFKSDPFDEQIDMLRINLLPPEQQQQMFVSLLDRYFERDIATLWEMSRFAMKTIPGLDLAEAEALFAETEQALLVDRNKNWMPVISDATARHDDIVIAVGAAHLMGNEGVLNLLQEDGWTLSRLD